MDNIIEKYPKLDEDDEFVYCVGVAYQKDMSHSIEYGKDYFDRYVAIENKEIAIKINAARIALTEKYCSGAILDVGIGSGEFIKSSRINVYGYDINPYGQKWLKEKDLFVDPYMVIPDEIVGLTMWDAMEHMVNPNDLLQKLRSNFFVFISLPIFDNIREVKKSKHYKPDEHYYYYTSIGLIGYMKERGFDFLEQNDGETQGGRENIGAFAFRKI